MCVSFGQLSRKSLALASLIMSLTVQAQTRSKKVDLDTPRVLNKTRAQKGRGGKSIVIAHPMLDTPQSAGRDLETYLMPDELINQMEGKYYFKIKDYSLKQGLSLHSRDSKLQRNYLGTPAEEQATREEMASFMKRYMIRKGLPKYLSSKKATRVIGDSYQKAETFVQNAGRIEIKSEDESWKFGSGINPFTTKAWLKYSSPTSSIELFNVFEQKDSLGIQIFRQEGRYVPMAQYLILQNAFETGLKFRYSPLLDSELKTTLPLYQRNVWNHAVTSISSTYRF
jgi:hypothetical protein